MNSSPESQNWLEKRDISNVFLPPNVSLTISFGGHESKHDVGNLAAFRTLIRSSDILLPEYVGWDEAALKNINAISNGNADLYQQYRKLSEQYAFGEFHNIVASCVYASHKKIEFVDVQAGTPLGIEIIPYIHGVQVTDILPTYDETINLVDEKFRKFAALQKEREDSILDQLGPKLSHIIDPNPKLRSKPRVDVVMLLGTEHTRVYDLLHRIIMTGLHGVPSVKYAEHGPYWITPETLLINHYKGKSIDSKKKNRALAEFFVMSVLRGIERNVKRDISSRDGSQFAPTVTDQEIRMVFDSLTMDAAPYFRVEFTPIVVELLQRLHTFQEQLH